jgi:F0F1-type ATP synthase assembly protein I
MKKFTYWAFGDAFTKIGGGMVGGIMVAYYVNQFMLNKPFNIYPWYFILISLGFVLLLVGYLAIRQSGYYKD